MFLCLLDGSLLCLGPGREHDNRCEQGPSLGNHVMHGLSHRRAWPALRANAESPAASFESIAQRAGATVESLPAS